ncbi:AAA family ATPase [Paenibacillus donghaensis]|uniref:Endonuclease GajA/Old nuclease/RecF-like AAA domain-containing protein n=1 Tax=Paenibacillus donghaensis TaxID=414771 RepID=A0A2Z2KHJ0_9BACL|nr:AAA family ATPase [Paenibacillus donghaensis]ASA25714.1 hypothetical protein B9T62_36300 [Paenibacillus donghaensis]
MWLKQLSIRGYRSFSEDTGIDFPLFSKMNLIIGSNNIGKSNLCRFMDLIRHNTNAIVFQGEQDLWQPNVGSIHADMVFVQEHNISRVIHLTVESGIYRGWLNAASNHGCLLKSSDA